MSLRRVARLDRLVAAGRRLAAPHDPLGAEARTRLVAAGSLSPEGVELALTRHLEIDPTPDDIASLLGAAGAADRCHVVLSAHVPVAALRAIALATATAPSVFVRPSRRDPVLARLLVDCLAKDPEFAAAEGSIALIDGLEARAGDEVHIYGSDEAIAAQVAALPAGVTVRAHGAGFGIALVVDGDDLDRAAKALASDVIPFDQRGCLSPRMVLVEGDAERALDFAEMLHADLGDAGARVPRGLLDPTTLAEVASYERSIEAIGQLFVGREHVVSLDTAPRVLLLPPTARIVHVVPARSAELLAPWARFVTTVGTNDRDSLLAREILARAPWARVAPLGRMQRPPLDGPVDLRPGKTFT